MWSTSKCPVSPERQVLDLLDLGSEVQEFNTHWGNICHWNFLFSHSEASDANIGIIANFGSFEKPLLARQF